MNYHIDLSKISIQQYVKKLKNAYLPPSRKILLLDIEKQFSKIEKQGIENLEELKVLLKTKKKLQLFALESGISVDYLTILIREINSIHPKPNRIEDFPEIEIEIIDGLGKVGIKNTLHLFHNILSEQNRMKLATETGISPKIIMKLTQFTDLSRVRWVNHTFAYMLYKAGYKTAQELANADAIELHNAIDVVNKRYGFYRAKIGLNDIRICIETAKDIPQAIEF